MYKYIAQDFLNGILCSLKINLYITALINDNRLCKLTRKILKYNFLMHFLPYILFYVIKWQFNLNIMPVLDVLFCPINIFSFLFHLLHYIDLVNIVCVYSLKTSRTGSAIDALSLTITMSIYQLVIYLTTSIINIIFNGRLHLLAVLINFIILTIYHSFYCFNNLWQYKKINMFYRIDMHEKLWPFYVGYGIISTIIYLHLKNPIMLGIYNLYMVLIISIPFMIKVKYPKKENNALYPKINLKIFSHMTGLIFEITKIIIENILKIKSDNTIRINSN